MKQVFKCDHCITTDIIPVVILEHEEKCTFNPTNKSCYTCKYRYTDYDLTFCEKKVLTQSDHFYDDVPCDIWESAK